MQNLSNFRAVFASKNKQLFGLILKVAYKKKGVVISEYKFTNKFLGHSAIDFGILKRAADQIVQHTQLNKRFSRISAQCRFVV